MQIVYKCTLATRTSIH